MEGNYELKHKVVYGMKVNVFRLLALISIILTLIFGEHAFVSDKLGVFYFIFSIFSFSLFLVFIIMTVILNTRKKRYGNYEEIDIVSNSIIYRSEKKGVVVYDIHNIKDIIVDKYSLRKVPDEQYYIKIIPYDDVNILKVPGAVSKYGEFVRKMRNFKSDYDIPKK